MADRFGQIVISSTDGSFQPVFYTVAQDPRKINGVELNITPGGGLQVGAPRLRRITARVGIINLSNTDVAEGLNFPLDRFEALRGQSVFIDHFLNRDRTIRWVVEDASPDHDGIRGSGWVFGTFSAVEDISPDLAAGLPLGSIVIPAPPVIEDEVGEDEVVPDFGTYGNVVDWFVGTNNTSATTPRDITTPPPGFPEAEATIERYQEVLSDIGDWFNDTATKTRLGLEATGIPNTIEEFGEKTEQEIGRLWRKNFRVREGSPIDRLEEATKVPTRRRGGGITV